MKFINPAEQLKKQLKSSVKVIPLEFRWLVFYSLTEGISIPLPRLMKNRKAFQFYKDLKRAFPSTINEKFNECIHSKLDSSDLEKLKNSISKRDAVDFWKTINERDSFTLKEVQAKVYAWRQTTYNVIQEELGLNEVDEPTEKEKQEILEGKKDRKIAEGIYRA